MKQKSISNIGVLTVILLHIIFVKSDISARVLSRKRRYLVFPEGSSLQMVFDETIPIVDNNLLVTTGETVALAWELPHQPFYVEEELMQLYDENGTLPLLNRNDETNSEINSETNQNPPIPIVYQNKQRVQDSYYFNDRKNERISGLKAPSSSSYYYGNNYYRNPVNISNAERDYYKAKKAHDFSQYGDNVRNKIDEYSAKTYDPWRRSDWSNTITVNKTTTAKPKPELHINPDYPFIKKRPFLVLPHGKRDIHAHRDELFVEHHRQSRYSLFKIIDKYLVVHGKNGTECILKTLCEARQRRKDGKRGSFVAEILGAIFRLPETNKHISDSLLKRYHDAVGASECSQSYSRCEDSIWTASFTL